MSILGDNPELVAEDPKAGYRLLANRDKRYFLESRLDPGGELVTNELSDQDRDRWLRSGDAHLRQMHDKLRDEHKTGLRERAARWARAAELASQAAMPDAKQGIDTASGAVVSAQGIISPGMTKSEFMESPLFAGGDWTNKKDGWYHAVAAPLTIGELHFQASVMFRHERMNTAYLSIDDARYGSSWADYSEPKELAADQRHREWLVETIGVESGKFPWGRIDCAYDSKSGFSSIILSYSSR